MQSHLKKEKTSNRQPNLPLKQLEKIEQQQQQQQQNTQNSKKKESIKIRAEINEKEMKETIAKINKTKSWFFEKINNTDKSLARLIKRKRRLKSTKL